MIGKWGLLLLFFLANDNYTLSFYCFLRIEFPTLSENEIWQVIGLCGKVRSFQIRFYAQKQSTDQSLLKYLDLLYTMSSSGSPAIFP